MVSLFDTSRSRPEAQRVTARDSALAKKEALWMMRHKSVLIMMQGSCFSHNDIIMTGRKLGGCHMRRMVGSAGSLVTTVTNTFLLFGGHNNEIGVQWNVGGGGKK